jgi:rhodanese-related sulfurtransferase
LIALGMVVQAGALGLLAGGEGAFAPALGAAILLGAGTALVYPTLIAAVSDIVQPRDRAQTVGVYRFWRDTGFVVGALAAGIAADRAGSGATIVGVAIATGASGVWVALTRWQRETIDDRLRRAQARIRRHEPDEAFEAVRRGALLVDLRSHDERERSGVVPGSIHIPRTVLEWRLDPECEFRNPSVAGLDRELILLCGDGYSSSLAVVSLRDLGFEHVADVVGGFTAWRAAGLPVAPAPPPSESLPGMGRPEPVEQR